MGKSIRDTPKKRGRPKTTGRGEGVMVRLHSAQLAVLDAWAVAQSDSPSRPEAIRRLVELGLNVSTIPAAAPASASRPPTAAKAAHRKTAKATGKKR
jgi:hypothetical protein